MFRSISERAVAALGLTPLEPIEEYRVELDQHIYFPGQTVTGVLRLTTAKPVLCRAITLELVGRANAAAKASGKDEMRAGTGYDLLQQHRQRYYARERLTVWGTMLKTPTIDGAGAVGHFGPPWSPNEGVLLVPVPNNGSRSLVLRVMDEDWGTGKADDKLGELLLDANWAVRECERNTILRGQALRMGGRPGYGEIDLIAKWVDELPGSEDRLATYKYLCKEGDRLLQLHVVEARGLMDKDLLSENDVYCQVYPVPAETVVSDTSALPKLPEPFTELAPTELSIPFKFQLPKRLPPSIETDSAACVRYSIYSCIDIKWMKSPSTRTFFTVCTRNPIEFLGSTGQPIHGSSTSKASRGCCGLLPSIAYKAGQLHLEVISLRRGFAPGERIPLQISAINNSRQPGRIHAALTRHFTAETLLRTHTWSRQLARADEEFVAPPGEKTAVATELMMPACAASFAGSDTEWMEDVRWLLAHRRGERFSQAEPLKGHPLHWHDRLEVQLTTGEGGPMVEHVIDVTVIPFPAGHDLFAPAVGRPVEPEDIVPGLPIPVGNVMVTFTPDPQGQHECAHPQEDLHCFAPEQLLWSPYCSSSKPAAWPMSPDPQDS
eukprot:jgi/Tetstr1/433317/TSEL_022604.t1